MAKITVQFGTNVEAEYTLEKSETKIGRSMECDIVVDNLGVSRHHCSILQEGASWVLADGGSNNGTYVGGQKISKHTLKDGDKIILGKHSLIYDANGFASAAKATAAKKGAAMGGEMTMFVDQAALAKAMAEGGKRMVIALSQGGREVLAQIARDVTTIGTQADIPARGFLIKPVQAEIIKTPAGHKLVAKGGWRAVKVNGSKVTSHDLKAGDVITIAGATLTYKQA
jgi:pSer/pThr/pTyr-binding forkhead associated (FHA) protein